MSFSESPSAKKQIQRANLEYLEEIYHSCLEEPGPAEDPGKSAWKNFFREAGFPPEAEEAKRGSGAAAPAKPAASDPPLSPAAFSFGAARANPAEAMAAGPSANWGKELKVFQLLQSYRDHGGLKARLDPLGVNSDRGFPRQEDFQIAPKDLEREFASANYLFGQKKPLREVIQFLEETYCGSLALQAGGCPPEVRAWFFSEFEKQKFILTKEQKLAAFACLAEAESLEKFLHSRFPGKKRFSIEGLDSLMPLLEYLLEKGAADLEMRDLAIGMAHRGRVNVLINLMKQDPKVIFSEFGDWANGHLFNQGNWTGDVKYHLGFSSERQTSGGPCRLYLGYNPSHLEAVNPVICGMTRALQRRNKDTKRRKSAVPVLIHGDASFCGQGSVSETLQLSQLKGYTVGGALHIILNNQLGFTTSPEEGRSTLFSSDLAKSIQAPVLLVNADDVEAALRAADMALRFRYRFGSDVFIELIGYRRHGHNEGDEPSFTQPLMYKKIKSQPSALQRYREQLVQESALTEARAEIFYRKSTERLERELEALKDPETKIKREDFTGKKHGIQKKPLDGSQTSKKHLSEVFQLLSGEPSGIHLHPKIKKTLQKRKRAIEADQLDWGLCELAAYGTLLKDGFSIRLTGQDSKRGTFSHRHAVYWDYERGEECAPLKKLIEGTDQECCLYNSPLSEMAALAFEYGNSCLAPDFLTLWEAQFGDFVNGAQIVLDQFIASGEVKWLQETDIVLLLPHGYEGQGPEHSSAYLERFLQLSAQNNMRVCNIAQPANFFHVLRRQKVLLRERKPLVVMTPKSLLRSPEALSSAKDLIYGKFEEVIWDQSIRDPREVASVVLCSGKVFYDLERARRKLSPKEQGKMAVFRLEQLYPFPASQLNPALNGFPCMTKILWLQEEPQNRGAWSYIKPRLEELLEALGQPAKVQYAGRPPKAAAAEGSEKAHKKEQQELINRCLSLV